MEMQHYEQRRHVGPSKLVGAILFHLDCPYIGNDADFGRALMRIEDKYPLILEQIFGFYPDGYSGKIEKAFARLLGSNAIRGRENPPRGYEINKGGLSKLKILDRFSDEELEQIKSIAKDVSESD
jgi:hypothetical protein